MDKDRAITEVEAALEGRQIIVPPWTEEEVEALNQYQKRGLFHPFTCGRGHNIGREAILLATTNGWVCLFCDYTLDWAHRWMLKVGGKK
jgi:hypothetical protein